MTTIETPDALFVASQYDIPFPKADGKEVDRIIIGLSGNLELDRNNPDHTQLVESLTLGRYLQLNVTASVDAKAQAVKATEDGTETVSHTVRLKLHSVEPT